MQPIRNFNPEQFGLSRRQMLRNMGAGFGSVALADMLAPEATAAKSPLMPRAPHFAPKAKRIIQLFMPGGPSQVDTFDYKPLIQEHA